MIPSSSDRVPSHTAPEVNRLIAQKAEARVAYYAAHPELIGQRLEELDREWDVERVLEVNSSALSLFGLVAGFTVNRRWLLLPLAVQVFFLQHAVQGWCPPLPALRRLGYRTRDEIDQERYALKALRGDFDGLARGGPTAAARSFRATKRFTFDEEDDS